MSLALINIVKYTPWLFKVWNVVGSVAVNILKIFVTPKRGLIVFVSFGGKRFDDSPRCIYEQMLKEHRFDKCDLVWAFIHPEKFDIGRGRKIKMDTFHYYKTLLQAECWVTNSTVERGLIFKGKKSFYINTFHGIPIKKMGMDISDSNKAFKSMGYGKYAPYDVFITNGKYDTTIFSRVFRLNPNSIKMFGYPRNDSLVSFNNRKNILRIKNFLNLELDKKIILYAPTYREYSQDKNNNCTIAPPIDWERWQKELGNDYVVLFRAHYEVVKVMNVMENDFLRNVSAYPNLDELMLVSDILISDYSSIFFDYSILGRPMFTFCYDYEEYAAKRGMYIDIRKELNDFNSTQEDLIDAIKKLDVEKRIESALSFRAKYMEVYGNASKKCVDLIYEQIN